MKKIFILLGIALLVTSCKEKPKITSRASSYVENLPEYTAVVLDSTDAIYIYDAPIDKHVEMPTLMKPIYDTAYQIRSEIDSAKINLRNEISAGGNGWSKAGYYLRPNVDDSVGIGITTPTEKLDVLGNIKASGSVKVPYVLLNGVTFSSASVGIGYSGDDLWLFDVTNGVWPLSSLISGSGSFLTTGTTKYNTVNTYHFGGSTPTSYRVKITGDLGLFGSTYMTNGAHYNNNSNGSLLIYPSSSESSVFSIVSGIGYDGGTYTGIGSTAFIDMLGSPRLKGFRDDTTRLPVDSALTWSARAIRDYVSANSASTSTYSKLTVTDTLKIDNYGMFQFNSNLYFKSGTVNKFMVNAGDYFGAPVSSGANILNVASTVLPSYTWEGDNNTGILRIAADQMALMTNGVNRIKIYNDSIPIENEVRLHDTLRLDYLKLSAGDTVGVIAIGANEKVSSFPLVPPASEAWKYKLPNYLSFYLDARKNELPLHFPDMGTTEAHGQARRKINAKFRDFQIVSELETIHNYLIRQWLENKLQWIVIIILVIVVYRQSKQIKKCTKS